MTTKQARYTARILAAGGVRIQGILLRDPELVAALGRLVAQANGNQTAAVAVAIRLADDLMHPAKSTLAATSREG